MKVVKKISEFGLNVFFEEDEKYLSFVYRGNLDLYWMVHSKKKNTDYKYDYFDITKENYSVYKLFEELFNDIKNINIFNVEDFIPFYLDDEEKELYLKSQKDLLLKKIEEEKIRYKLYNRSNYNELFDSNSDTITWYSDETAHEVANILKIRKEKDFFRIEFYVQPYIEGYDEDFRSRSYIPIRFRNSGSSYDPFNQLFMKMYNDMNDIDDVNDINHQIHIEEYLYNTERTKKLTK